MLLDGKRLVYIEDDPRNRQLVEMILTGEGAKVWFDRWGAPALALSAVIGHIPLDMILLDLMFANGYSGYDVYAELRKQIVLDKVPVVMISAADAAVEMPKARQLGLSSYIVKPIDADHFAHQIKSVLEGQPIWQLAAAAWNC